MLTQARKLLADNQPVAAIALLTQILTANPEDKQALSLRAVTFVQMGQTKEALTDVDALITLEPAQLAYSLLRADILAIDGQTENAIAAYHSILAQKPEAGNVVLRLGNLLQQAKRRLIIRISGKYLCEQSNGSYGLVVTDKFLSLSEHNL